MKELETFLKEGHPLNKELFDLAKSSLTFKTSDIDLLLRTMTGLGEAPYGVKVDIEFAACLLHDERKPRG